MCLQINAFLHKKMGFCVVLCYAVLWFVGLCCAVGSCCVVLCCVVFVLRCGVVCRVVLSSNTMQACTAEAAMGWTKGGDFSLAC